MTRSIQDIEDTVPCTEIEKAYLKRIGAPADEPMPQGIAHEVTRALRKIPGLVAATVASSFLCVWIGGLDSPSTHILLSLCIGLGVITTFAFAFVTFLATFTHAFIGLATGCLWRKLKRNGELERCERLYVSWAKFSNFNQRLRAIKEYDSLPTSKKAGSDVAEKYAEERTELLAEQEAIDTVLTQEHEVIRHRNALEQLQKTLSASTQEPRYRVTRDVSDLVYTQQELQRQQDIAEGSEEPVVRKRV